MSKIGMTAKEILEEEKKMKREGEEKYILKKNEKARKKDPKTPTGSLQGFIFDEDKVIQKKVFSSHMLDNDTFAFGMLLPSYQDILDKKGEVVGKEQVWKPVIITSDRRGIAICKEVENKFKISYEAIPYEMKLKWKLASIDNFLHDELYVDISGINLFNNIKKEYEHYCSYRLKNWYAVNTLWDLGTYLNQLFSAFPIKEERGLKGTAKTKTMSVSSNITLNGTEIMINPSEATLFRITEELRSTKYIDEAEKLFKPTKQGIEADNRVELINASFTRNGVVPRQEKMGNKFVTKWYHVYSPTRVASINGLFGATEDRAITQIHTKSPDNDPRGETDVEEDRNDPKWQILRNQCYLWALHNWKKVQEEYTNFKVETKLKKRDMQIWKPILVLAKIIDKEVFQEVLEFAEKLANQKKNDNIQEGTTDFKLLEIVNDLLLQGKEKIHIKEIHENYGNIYGKDYIPAYKTIGTHLDKVGFKEFKDRDNSGMYYLLTKELFDEIINPITNSFTTYSTHTTHLQVNEENSSVESMKNMKNNKNNSVEYVENVGNVDTLAKENIPIIKIKSTQEVKK